MRFHRRFRELVGFVRTYGQHFPLVFRSVFDLRCRVILLEGRLCDGSTSVSVLYLGRRQNLAYLTKTMFDNHRVRGEKRSTIFTCRRAAGGWLSEADLLVVDIGWPYHRRINRRGEFLEVPDWIDMGVEIDGDWDSVAARFRRDARRNDLRKIRRAGYRCEISSDRSAIARFYDEMYVPYVRFAHGEDALLAPRWHVIRQGARGALIQVADEQGIVAAGIVYPAGDVLVSLWMGLPPQLHENPPDAVISALYVFLIRYAIDLGYEYVDFAGTRGFLNDGVFQFKRKWGAEIDDGFSPSSLLLQLQNAEARTLDMLRRLPVVTRGIDGLEAVIIRSGESAADCVSDIERRFAVPGLQRVNVLVVGEDGPSDADCEGRYGIGYRIRRVDSADLPERYTARWFRGPVDGLPAGGAIAVEAENEC